MNSRRIAIATLALFTQCLFGALAFAAAVVDKGTINYGTNQLTLTGSGFLQWHDNPTVLFNKSQLKLVSASDTQIVANLPANLVAGTFRVVVKMKSGERTGFDLTYGAVGPQGAAGPTGAQGPKGSSGAIGPAGPAGPTGPAGGSGSAPLSAVGLQEASVQVPASTPDSVTPLVTLNSVILPEAGEYVLSGSEVLYNESASEPVTVQCGFDSTAPNGLLRGAFNGLIFTVGPNQTYSLPLNGYFVADTAPVTVSLYCFSVESTSPELYAEGADGTTASILIAIHVQ